MSFTPTCPKCGSIKVKRGHTTGVCLEPDCKEIKPWKQFKERKVGYCKSPNQHWRDPVALTMDGYDD